jgi:hypothetical protein
MSALVHYEGMCYLLLSVQLLTILLIVAFGPNEYQPYRPKARWKKKLKKSSQKYYSNIINLSGELIFKLNAILPNYKTRHKCKRCCHRTYHGRSKYCERSSSRLLLLSKWRRLMAPSLALPAARAYATSTRITSTSSPSSPIDTLHSDRGGAHSVINRGVPVSFQPGHYEIYVDNCASRSITNDLGDFIDDPIPSDVKIVGTNGVSKGTLMGTVQWTIEDDQGRVHGIKIPNTLYSANNRSRLLSPQHWSQEAKDKYPIRNGTWCATLDDRVILFWGQQKYRRTAFLLAETSNVGVIHGIPREPPVKAYSNLEKRLGDEVIAMPTVLDTIHHIVNDEGEDTSARSPEPKPDEEPSPTDLINGLTVPDEVQEASSTKGDKPMAPDNAAKVEPTNIGQEYLYWHSKLGHLSHSRMQHLAKSGKIPKHLNLKRPPICIACLHGKATKKPWRSKGSVNKTPRETTYPGECIAVDQLESTTAGFIGQLKGAILTNQRYKHATVFVDLFSDYTYVHMHTAITSAETVKAKRAFEAHAETFGIKVKHYHADNGRFQDIAFKEDCSSKGQPLSYCGVNAHFQNGRAERKIRDLQDGARTSLLHAMKKWPQAITLNLWPYAIRYVNDVNNCVPRKGQEYAPIEIFSSTKMKMPLHQFYHFGCPTYVLDPNLQSGQRSGMKWKQRTRLGVNLGFSPQHAKSVHLVLSLTTGCVSPQFHCTFDNNFETLKEYHLPDSLWQEKAHL